MAVVSLVGGAVAGIALTTDKSDTSVDASATGTLPTFALPTYRAAPAYTLPPDYSALTDAPTQPTRPTPEPVFSVPNYASPPAGLPSAAASHDAVVSVRRDNGQPMLVSVARIELLPANNPQAPLPDGHRLIAVSLRVQNTGTTEIPADVETADGWFYDIDGVAYPRDTALSEALYKPGPGLLRIAAGKEWTGVMVIEVPESARLADFRLGGWPGVAAKQSLAWSLAEPACLHGSQQTFGPCA